MSEYRLNFRDKYGHPDMIIYLQSTIDADTSWLFDYFDQEIQKGTIFQNEQTIQIGWGIVKLRSNADNDFEILEPRFDTMPINWICGVNNTFRHLSIQRKICAEMGVDPEYPSLLQSGVIPQRFLEKAREFKMNRDVPEGRDSGWVFYEADSKESNSGHCSLYEISTKNPGVVPFLSLPPATLILFSKTEIEISLGGRMISSKSNEFLKKILDSRVFGASCFS